MKMISRSARIVSGAALVAGAALISGCSPTSSSMVGTQHVRTSIATAPTDLQLLCASEAGNRLGGSALPISSTVAAGGSYVVHLRLPSGNAVCHVDSAGTITALERI